MSCVCLRQGSRKKGRHQLHPATSLSPSQDTEGSEINLAAAPKIERKPPLEQDAGCVRTSRGHCGQQSYFCSTTGPPRIDAHSFIRLPASRVGDTHRDTKKAYTPTSSANGRSVGVERVPFGETNCDGVLVANVLCHLRLFVSFSMCIYMRAACWFWRWRTMETHLVLNDLMSQTHCLSVCLCVSVSLFLSGSMYGTSWILDQICDLFLLLLLSLYRWFTVAYRHGCTLFYYCKKAQTTHKRKTHWHANRMISYSLLPLFVEPLSLSFSIFLTYIHTYTHKNTHTSIVH